MKQKENNIEKVTEWKTEKITLLWYYRFLSFKFLNICCFYFVTVSIKKAHRTPVQLIIDVFVFSKTFKATAQIRHYQHK